MRARDFLTESKSHPDIHSIVRKFLPFVQQHLKLSDLPEIELLDQPLEGTFGRYSDGNIRVMAHGRHPIDVLRTLAHELVHYKQDSEGRIHDDSGETGSDEENEANAVAGVIMRDFDQANPELLAALKGLSEDLDEELVDEWSTTDDEIDAILKKKGYKKLGAGVDQSAYLEPGTGHVLKIFGTQTSATAPKQARGKPQFSADHKMFFAWAEYCNKNANNPFLPKFSGFESFYFKGQTYLQIRQEQLTSNLNMGKLAETMANAIEDGEDFEEYQDLLPIEYSRAYVGLLSQFKKQVGERGVHLFWDTLEELYRIGRRKGWGWDLHSGNFMMRGQTIVIVDPWVVKQTSSSSSWSESAIPENFQDGRHPEDKGDAKRHGINTKASVSSLRKTAKQGGRKGQLAHWLANMKAGRAKKS